MDSGILKRDPFTLLARYVPTGPIRKQVNYGKMRFWSALPAGCYSGPQNAGVLGLIGSLAFERYTNAEMATYLFYSCNEDHAYENQKRCFY